MGEFVHLHLHTEYSLLDGATRIASIADKAIEYNQKAVAITDHGVMYGVVEFYRELKKKGVKPIIGCEVYVAPRGREFKEGKLDSTANHLILLCKNEIGYKNLCYMVSESFINGFYSRPRIDMDLLRENHEGLVALSGCLAGKVARLILAGAMTEAEAYALEMKEIFGEDFYLEIQNHNLTDDLRLCYGVKTISEKLNIPMVATNDVHYLEKSDAEVQATLMCVQTNNVITEGRPFGFETDEFYFKSTEEMEELFALYPGAIENTVKIADKCNFDFEFYNLHLPTFVPEGGKSHKEKLYEDAINGFEKHAANGRFNFDKYGREAYEERLYKELQVIDKMGFNAYFLIVSDFVRYAKEHDIPVGPGRGSGAASLVAFCIGITDVDPIAFDLLFERFLNVERVSMPDFDIDFCYNRREEVIEYVKHKYGEDKVAQIVTFGTLAPRAAIRDIGRALGMSYDSVDKVAKLVGRDAKTIEQALENKELRSLYIFDNEIRRLIDMSKKVEGMPRHASTHAAGVVITEKPTYEYVPLSYSGSALVTQFDMKTDADLGLVKFDFLGLRYLTVIKNAEDAIKRRDPDFNVAKIPFDDKKTFQLLYEAKTDGVFQLESGGMKSVLARLRPTCLEDIIATVALFRPGPMDSIDKFIARKHGREGIEYKTDRLKGILDVTYGCIVYQEQVMQICRELAGYSYAHADIVRRAMSKKEQSAMDAERDAFIDGCLANGVSEDIAEDIFHEMVGFAKYAFNKGHATVYAVISYRTAYLKAHYPEEYFAALMSSVLGNANEIKAYIADAQKMRIRVLPPDINMSDVDFAVEGKNIRFGILALRNLGRNIASAIVENRKHGPYKSFDDFVTRLSDVDLNRKALESLIKCGAFDSLGVSRSSLLACYDIILKSEQNKKRSNIPGQIDMFSTCHDDSIISSQYQYPDIKEYSIKELLMLEKESSGMYLSGHMIDNYSEHLRSLECDRINDILDDLDEDNPQPNPKYKDKMAVRISGLITEKKTKETKNGTTMAFLTLEDRYGEIEVIVFAKHYQSVAKDLFVDNAVIISGNISYEEGEKPRILLSSLEPLVSNDSYKARAVDQYEEKKAERIFIKVPNDTDRRIEAVIRTAHFNPGPTPIVIYSMATQKYSILKNITTVASEKTLNKLKDLFGEGNVVVK